MGGLEARGKHKRIEWPDEVSAGEVAVAEVLGDDRMQIALEHALLKAAADYERGNAWMRDEHWDALGVALQDHPERWTPWFRARVPWVPGGVEKPTCVGLVLDGL